MKPVRRTRIAALLILAALAWSPGVLYAGCAAVCPFANAKVVSPCCRTHGAAPAVRAASCCETLRAAAPAATAQAIKPAASAPFALVAPLAKPSEPACGLEIAALLFDPPPLHQGIGLYTLHATFLI
jgi:hypothetical protein